MGRDTTTGRDAGLNHDEPDERMTRIWAGMRMKLVTGWEADRETYRDRFVKVLGVGPCLQTRLVRDEAMQSRIVLRKRSNITGIRFQSHPSFPLRSCRCDSLLHSRPHPGHLFIMRIKFQNIKPIPSSGESRFRPSILVIP